LKPLTLFLIAVSFCVTIALAERHFLADTANQTNPTKTEPKNTMSLNKPAKFEQTRYVTWGDEPAQFAVIWLHGLGASSDDFPPVVPYLDLDKSLNIQFVFPNAPDRPVTINGGMQMPAWYDIKSFDIEGRVDREGIVDSMQTLEWHIAQLNEQGIPSEQIIIAGFSQGGAVSYYTLLRSQSTFAGAMLLSTYMPFEHEAAEVKQAANAATPVFAAHGTHDPVVTFDLGEGSVKALQALEYLVEWKTYPIDHSVSMDEIKDIGRWINGVFGSIQ